MATSYAITPGSEGRDIGRGNSADPDRVSTPSLHQFYPTDTFSEYPELVHDLMARLGQMVPHREENTPHPSPGGSRSMHRNDARLDRTNTDDNRMSSPISFVNLSEWTLLGPIDLPSTFRRGSWPSIPVMREQREDQALHREQSVSSLPRLSSDLLSPSSNPSLNNPSAKDLIASKTEPEPTSTKPRPVRLSQVCRQLKQHIRAIRISVSKLFKGRSK